MLSRNGFINFYPIILYDLKPQLIVNPSWPSGLERWFTCHGMPGMGSNTTGDIYFDFDYFRSLPVPKSSVEPMQMKSSMSIHL